MSEICIEIDEDVKRLLGASPEQIQRHALEMIVLELYRRRTVSAGRAATLLGLGKMAFIRWSGSLGIPYFDVTVEELREELKLLEGS